MCGTESPLLLALLTDWFDDVSSNSVESTRILFCIDRWAFLKGNHVNSFKRSSKKGTFHRLCVDLVGTCPGHRSPTDCLKPHHIFPMIRYWKA